MLPFDKISSDDWRAFIAANSLPRLGAGISRTAWALNDDYVIKVVGNDTYHQHESEVERWRTASPRLRQYLAPIVASGPDWSVMARAQETLRKRSGGNDYDVSYRATSDRLEDRTGITDLHADNIGYFPDARIKYKVIDYGF